ncbi:MAG: M1 family metallopeptidase [Candidatus Woesearchaeota archaeon]|jgi:aminopeptidase N
MPEIQPTEKISEQQSREFAFYPDDFGKLPVKVEHFNLFFDVFDEYTVVESDMTMTVIEDSLQKISLDAKNLEIQEVALYDKVRAKGDHEKKVTKKVVSYIYDTDANKFHVTLPKMKKGDTFTLFTKTITRPTKNILEGLYYDETPAGCPPTQITQCQQWGFQRLTPCYDDMTAKCTYTVTIIADSRYTSMISNGDIVSEFKQGKKDLGNGRSMIRYYNHITPMAPYLFFLGVGTYKTVECEFEYPHGKKFMIELLIPPQADTNEAERALDILSHSIMWIHLHTGAGKYEALDVKKKIWQLLKKRDFLKAKKQDVSEVRKELAERVKSLNLGYVYTGDVYREIGMQNSNFGGMENVGNTTIVTNRIMPTKSITDDSFEYMMEVKAHEFYHNLNGSEVTGVDPFVLWLNEAVTVHVESEYLSHIMGEAYTRIVRVMTLHAPMFGTFAEDSGPAAMPIIPHGFNTPDELITGMTYIKAPEVVQMIETLMGKEKFVKALALFHERFKHKNANSEDWLNAMEEVSGLEFKHMTQGWLTRSGFPRVYVTVSYKEGIETLKIHQKGFDEQGPWQFPFVFCPVDSHGKDMGKTIIHWIKKETEIIEFPVKEEPAYISLNRNHALYGKVFYEGQTESQLVLQALKDSDIVNRYMAFSTLLDKEKAKLVKDITAEVSSVVISTYGKILLDEKISPEVKALFLVINENVRDEFLSFKYKEIYAAKEKVRKAIATAHKKDIFVLYTKFAAKKITGTYLEQQFAGMKQRSLKNILLSLLASFDNEEAWKLIKHQLLASHATDKNAAMSLYLNSNAPDKIMELELFKKEAETNLVAWESFLRIVGSNNSNDSIAIMNKTEKDPHFRIEQSNEQHALYLPFAANRKKSLLTKEGLDYLTEIMITLSKLNEYSGFMLLATFSDLEKLDANNQCAIVSSLQKIKNAISKKECPSVYNNIQRILKKCPKAVALWKENKECCQN